MNISDLKPCHQATIEYYLSRHDGATIAHVLNTLGDCILSTPNAEKPFALYLDGGYAGAFKTEASAIHYVNSCREFERVHNI